MPRFILPVTFNNDLLPTLPAIGKPIFSDTFNRANGTPGTTEVGRRPWELFGTSAGANISNNALRVSGTTGSAALAVINVNQTTGRFRAKSVSPALSASSSDAGSAPVLVLRAIDASNYVSISQAYKADTGKTVWRISSRVNGAGGVDAVEFDNDARIYDVIEVSIEGDVYNIWKNGVLKLSNHTLAHVSKGTRFGIGKNLGSIESPAWDDMIFFTS